MSKFVGKPQMLREVNSSMLAHLIYEQGPLSKPELARLTSLSLPTVSKLVDDLEMDGIICPVGLAGRGAGRKAMLYETNKDSGCLMVLYYRGGQYTCRVTDIIGQTLYENAFPLDTSDADTALQATFSAIDALMKEAPHEVKSIGIGVPGVVLPDGHLLGIPKITAWEGLNLQHALADRYPADICVENDVKLTAVGYYRTRLCDRWDNIVYIYVGNGIGSGIIINRRLYRGSTNFSGEVGFMAPLRREPPKVQYTMQGGYLEAELSRLKKDRASPEGLEAMGILLGAAAANHVAVLNPDAIVFGGEIMSDELIQEIKKQMPYYCPSESMPEILYDGSDTTGIEGLVLTCRGTITTRMQLVQNGGV